MSWKKNKQKYVFIFDKETLIIILDAKLKKKLMYCSES
jgi:hypothetical protein